MKTVIVIEKIAHRRVAYKEIVRKKINGNITVLSADNIREGWSHIKRHKSAKLVILGLIDEIDGNGIDTSWLVKTMRTSRSKSLREMNVVVAYVEPEELPRAKKCSDNDEKSRVVKKSSLAETISEYPWAA